MSTFSWSDVIHNPLDGRAYLAQKPGLLIEKYKDNGRNQHEKISYEWTRKARASVTSKPSKPVAI